MVPLRTVGVPFFLEYDALCPTSEFFNSLVDFVLFQLTFARRQLNLYQQQGKILKMDVEDVATFNAYESNLHLDAENLAVWTLEEEASRVTLAAAVYERLVAIYCVAGKPRTVLLVSHKADGTHLRG